MTEPSFSAFPWNENFVALNPLTFALVCRQVSYDEKKTMDLRKHVRLLVVESEPEFRDQLREIIELCSHQYEIVAEFAGSGLEARNLMVRFDPSVVLMDMHAADNEAVALMRGCSELEVPVVATGELRSREAEEQAFRHGAVAFMTRSEDPEDIETILHTLATVSGQCQVRH